MNLLQLERKSRLIVASLIASFAVAACNDGGGVVEPVADPAPKLVRESASQWRIDGKDGATIVVNGNRVRIVAGKRKVELSAETSALFSRVLAGVAKGDSLIAKQVGSGRHIRPAANQAQLEKARQNIAAHRARRQSANGLGIASMDGCGGGDMRAASPLSSSASMCEEYDMCGDIGLALYYATESWRGMRDGLLSAWAAFSLNMIIDYLYDQSTPGMADLNQIAQSEADFAYSTLSMEFLQIEFGLNHCFGPYE